MAQSFFFYDLETSGISPRDARIMQFAGQRTDMDMQPIGEPFNIMIKLTPDILPDPDAIMVTGITPQDTVRDGITEAEFIKIFQDEISTPGTIFLGYNTVRFDDEFMRCLLYRNFAHPYEWQFKDGRGKWDLLDLARMTRAIRPEGIEWPFLPDGKPTVRLEYMTRVNNLDHQNAHDALSDVNASIAVAKLIKDKQPDLYNYLYNLREKRAVKVLVEGSQPFIYTSGKYSNDFLKTTVVSFVAKHPHKDCAVVFDLRQDPTEFLKMAPHELVERWKWVKDRESAPARLPAKTVKYNRCPAISKIGAIKDPAVQESLGIDMEVIAANLKKLKSNPDFAKNIISALEMMDKQQQTQWVVDENDVDCQLYDGFLNDHDCRLLPVIRAAAPEELIGFADKVQDKRLKALLPLYKARNYPKSLSSEERETWDEFCRTRIFGGDKNSRFARFARRLEELSSTKLTDKQRFALEELKLYAESLMPAELAA
jgi:exodeoxyribonuclease-1